MLGFHFPWEKFFSKPPPVHALKSFRCACYPLLRPFNKNKLQPRYKPYVFLSYPPLSKGYICLDPTSNKIYIACHFPFNETLFPFANDSHFTNPHIPFSSSLSDWFPYSLSPINTSMPSPSIAPHTPSLPSDFDLVSSLLPSFLSSSCPIPVVPPPIDTPSSVDIPPSSSLPVFADPILPSSCSSNTNPTALVPSSTNSYSMIKRSKHEIYNPKVMQVQCDYIKIEPPSFAIASKHP